MKLRIVFKFAVILPGEKVKYVSRALFTNIIGTCSKEQKDIEKGYMGFEGEILSHYHDRMRHTAGIGEVVGK